MIIVKQDAELMKNLLPANPVPAANRFVGFVDENTRPGLFALSQDNKLNLIIENAGVRTLYDWGKILGITTNIQAFDAKQALDGTLSVVIASTSGTGSGLYLLFGLKPAQLLSPPSNKMHHDDTVFPTIHHIFMSNFSFVVGSYNLPMVFIALQPRERITKEDQLAYVKYDVSSGNIKLSLDQSWKLATNPELIVDVAFATNRLGQGVFVLYKSQVGMKLQFKTFAGNAFAVEPRCPQGAQCVATYVDPQSNESVLIVGGTTITRFAFKDYKSPTGTGTVITPPANLPSSLVSSLVGLKNIHIYQSGSEITLWYTTAKDAAYYYSTTAEDFANGTLVPLLNDGKAGQISGMMSALSNSGSTVVKSLLTVDERGNMKILQQASDTGIWDSHPFYTASNTNNIEVTSYTMRFTALSDGTPKDPKVSNCQLFLRASGAMGATLNGVSASLDQDGAWYTADASGVLTFIVSTESYSCYTIQCENFKSEKGEEQAITSNVLDPSYKPSLKMMTITDGNSLLNAKTQKGEPLIPPGTVSQTDANDAAAVLVELNKAHIRLNEPAARAAIVPVQRSLVYQPELRETTSTFVAGCAPLAGSLQTARSMSLSSIGSTLWDWFHWLEDKVSEVANWFLDKAGDLLRLVIHWGGQIFTFVLDTITAVGKAVSWVWKKIEVGIEKLIDFLGFIFNWGDILECSDSLVTYLNSGLGYSESRLDDLNTYAQQWITQLKASMKDNARREAPEITVSSQTSTDLSTKAAEAHHTVAFNWSSDQLKSGGFSTNSTIHSGDGPTDADRLSKIWDDIVNIVKDLENLVLNIGKDIGDLFTGHTSTASILARLEDQLVDTALSTLSNVVDALLNSIALLINTFKEMGNYAIEVPIFTYLWKLITNGRSFTLFNFFSLIVAIPATILCKLATGKKMPVLTGRLTATTFGNFVNGTVDAGFKNDMIVFSTASTIGAGVVALVVELIAFAIDAIPSGGFMASSRSSGTLALSAPVGVQSFHPVMMKSVSPKVGNAIDSASLTFSLFGLYASWPLHETSRDRDLRWAIWGLDLSDTTFLAVSRAVGYKFDIPRVQTKKFLGIWETCTSIPRFILEMIIAAHDYQLPSTDPDKNDGKTTMHVVEGIAGLSASWSFGVAAITDGDPAAEEVCIIAMAVMGLSMATKYAIKSAEFIGDHI